MNMKEHIVIKVILIIILAGVIGGSIYYQIPSKIIDYYTNEIVDKNVSLDLDEHYQLTLEKKETFSASSSNPSVVKIDGELNLTPVKAGTATIHVKTAKQDMTCDVTINNTYLNPPKIYLEPGSTYTLKKDSGKNITYASNNKAITVNNGVIKCNSTGTATIQTTSDHKTYINTVICNNVMSLMKSQSVTVYDATSNKYLYQKLSSNRMNPASITKVLTVYTFLQKISNVNVKATLLASEVSQPKSTGAVVTGMSPTESITYNDLLHGALLVSGADAVLALTRQTYGSTEALAAAMNANAKKFGMYNSHFTNGIGLTDANHYTTGVDITKLLNNVLKDSKFTKIFHSKKYTSSDGKHTFYSPSRSYGSNVLGAKNGLTNAAANCVTLEAKVNNHKIYITTMHASTPAERKADVKTILNYLKFKIK